MEEVCKTSDQTVERDVRNVNRHIYREELSNQERSRELRRAVIFAEVEVIKARRKFDAAQIAEDARLEDVDAQLDQVEASQKELTDLLAETEGLFSGVCGVNAKVDEYMASESYKQRRAEANLVREEEDSRGKRDGVLSKNDGKKKAQLLVSEKGDRVNRDDWIRQRVRKERYQRPIYCWEVKGAIGFVEDDGKKLPPYVSPREMNCMYYYHGMKCKFSKCHAQHELKLDGAEGWMASNERGVKRGSDEDSVSSMAYAHEIAMLKQEIKKLKSDAKAGSQFGSVVSSPSYSPMSENGRDSEEYYDVLEPKFDEDGGASSRSG
jgi:hypothetical protein